LQAARDLEAKKEWTDAVEEYLAILASAGDELVPLSRRHFVQARWRCHRQLALMPAEALALYRKRIDAQAKKWYDAAAAERDPRQLRRVVNEAFCSRPAEAALDMLGELAFERGQIEEAEHWWRMLARPASQAPGDEKPAELDFLYPDPQGDVARYRAKQLLARLFHGDSSFSPELKAFRALHPKSEGWLAGRKGNYGEILQTLSEQADLKEAPRSTEAWLTFAGDITRNRILASPPDRNWLSRLCEEAPARFDLANHRLTTPDDNSVLLAKAKVPAASDESPAFAFFPIILDHRVVVADTSGVTIYDPLTGAAHDWSPDHGARGEGKRETKLPAPPDMRFTLTAVGKRLYVRLATPGLDPPKKGQEESYLVCLDWNAAENGLRERWRAAAPQNDHERTVFEGSPVVDGDRAFAAFTRGDDRATSGVVCLDAATGVTRWRQDVCEFPVDPKQPRNRRHLLTLAGANLVSCSQAGVIVALDAATGKRVWAVRYQAVSDTSPRDLTPCLYDGGQIFVAPADYNKLMCLDATTGQTLWERTNIEVVHLLGAADGRLIFNTREGIRAVRVASGLDEWSAPALALKKPFTCGRGLILGNLVLYPTVDGVKALNVEDGQPTDRLNVPNGRLDGVRGHLAYADGVLAITDRTQLTVFVAPALLRNKRKEDAQRTPDSVPAQYRLALAETDAGNVEEAARAWQRVEAAGTSEDRNQGVPLREMARMQRHELFLSAAEQMRQARRWDDAESFLVRAAEKDFPASRRAAAIAQRAAIWEKAQVPARAAAAWQELLRDATLRQAPLADETGTPQTADVFAAARLGGLIRSHGPEVYQSVEREAERASQTWSDHAELLAQYPHAAVASDWYLARTAALDGAGQHGLAAALWRQRLRHCIEREHLFDALARLGHVYESEGCTEAARRSWQQLEKLAVDSVFSGLLWRGLATGAMRRLKDPGIQADAWNELLFPWRRHRETVLKEDERLLPGDDIGSSSSGDLFFGRRRMLICRAEDSGQPRWEVPLPEPPTWMGCQDDWLMVGGDGGVQALTRDSGAVLWRFSAPRLEYSFATGDKPAKLGAFRLSEGKLYFLQGERRFFALDAETGLVLWSRWAPDARLGLDRPAGYFFANYQANGARVVLQTGVGKWWLLDATDGRLIQQGDTMQEAWAQSPVILDRHRWCLPVDPQRILQFDPETGKELWTYEVPGRTISAGIPPLLLSDGQNLGLVLARNYGFALQRLDPSTGKAMWDRERLVSRDPIELNAIALDRESFFLAARDNLSAYNLIDGRVLWERPLPFRNGKWRVALFRDQVVVYPSAARAVEFRVRGPFGTLQCTLTAFAEDPANQGYPVILADPRTGLLDQRLNFAVPWPSLRIRIEPDSAGLEARVRTIPPPSPTRVRFAGGAAAVVLPDRLWRLTARKTD
jgi:outer membrane protein assembly factor BamB/tetratricopeptide (TPR) repeat protein